MPIFWVDLPRCIASPFGVIHLGYHRNTVSVVRPEEGHPKHLERPVEPTTKTEALKQRMMAIFLMMSIPGIGGKLLDLSYAVGTVTLELKVARCATHTSFFGPQCAVEVHSSPALGARTNSAT